jgi:DeoR/GlpR family transcriptional regulator of sugar metabolism
MIQRRLDIIELLETVDRLDVTTLADKFSTSQSTIRKDLEYLENQGLLKRQHGYAIRVSPDNINYRMAFNYESKQAIARAAINLVSDGETLMIESGSTCALFASMLVKEKKDITIITNSSFIARYLPPSGAKVVLLGGEYHPDAEVVVGPFVKMCASQIYVDKFFVGANGFSPIRGFLNSNISRAEAVQSMAESANKKYVLIDNSKLSMLSTVALFPNTKLTGVICNEPIPLEAKEYFCHNDIELISATL